MGKQAAEKLEHTAPFGHGSEAQPHVISSLLSRDRRERCLKLLFSSLGKRAGRRDNVLQLTLHPWPLEPPCVSMRANAVHLCDSVAFHKEEPMKTQQLLVVLTVVNLSLLVYSLAKPGAVDAQAIAPVLRGRGLEIVDDQGRIRASITVIPANPSVKMPDGTTGLPRRCSQRPPQCKNRCLGARFGTDARR